MSGPEDFGGSDYDVEPTSSAAGEIDAPASTPAKRARKPRREHDAYHTVNDLADACVQRVATLVAPAPTRILEPTAGEGAFVGALRRRYDAEPKIVAIDIQPEFSPACLASGASKFIGADFLSIPDAALAGVDLIIGNPPFRLAAAIVKKCRMAAPDAIIAFILPVGFVGHTKTDTKGDRRDTTFWATCPITYFAAIHPRPSFTNDGRTDRMEYALLGFGSAWSAYLDGRRVDDPIVWKGE